MHDNDDGVQGTSEPKDCTTQQHEEDDAPAMHQDSASEDGFEPLDSYSATITSQRMMVRVSKHTARCVSNSYLHLPLGRRGQRRSGRLRSPRPLAFSLRCVSRAHLLRGSVSACARQSCVRDHSPSLPCSRFDASSVTTRVYVVLFLGRHKYPRIHVGSRWMPESPTQLIVSLLYIFSKMRTDCLLCRF